MTAGPWDLVVVGGGAVGGATALAAAQRGASVLVLDRFGRGHLRGSHHGGARVTRHAYFEHPDYVPLLRESTRLYDALAKATGRPLREACGVLIAGPPGSALVRLSAESADKWGVPVEHLVGPALEARVPGLRVAGMEGLLEPGGGYLRSEDAVRAHLQAAEAAGARVETGVGALGLDEQNDRVVVRTNQGERVARAVAVAAGAYTARLVPDWARVLRVTRELQGWTTLGPAATTLPCWLLDRGEAPALYGLPTDPLAPSGAPWSGRGKVALHGGGTPIDPEAPWPPLTAAEQARLAAAAREAFTDPRPVATAWACRYTSTPDGHFLVDQAPGCRRIWAVAGLSGHGFKLAPALGVALADLALQGETDLPVGFLRASRLA